MLAATRLYLEHSSDRVMGKREADSDRRDAFLRNRDNWTLDHQENSAAQVTDLLRVV